MNSFETVERRDGHTYVVKNGVESTLFVAQIKGGAWAIFQPAIAYTVPTKDEATRRIARAMGDWHTASGAAERLVELGAFGKPPSAHDVCMWARNGLLPNAVKVPMPGQGGSWRIPEAALAEFVEWRKGQ